MANLIILQLGVCLFAYVAYRLVSRKNASATLPPGPRRLPIIGNLLDLPPDHMPTQFHWLKHIDKYGPISSITVLGQNMVILHDKATAHELLEKQSLKTSMRPTFDFAEMCDFTKLLSFMQYNDAFRVQRKLVHQQMGTRSNASRFNGVQDVESRRFLLRVLNKPDNLLANIRTEAVAIILKTTYGYSIDPSGNDPLVIKIEEAMVKITQTFVPLTFMVDIFPFLRHIPAWLSIFPFKETARKWGAFADAVSDAPYSFSREKTAEGVHRPSYVSSSLEKCGFGDKGSHPTKEEEKAIRDSAMIMYAGGAETSVAGVYNFFLAMTMFPQVQKKAQEEIDRVIGNERLPNFSDRKQLPYINAVVKETLRWLPITPTGLPHVTSEDVSCKGYTIPKGSILYYGTWWFLHDPQVYSNPDIFDPERFLEPRNEPDPGIELFGYGRRICPGRFVGEDNIFITISRVMASLNVSMGVESGGRERDSKRLVIPGLIGFAAPFPCKIEARSAKHAELIRSVETDHPWEESDARLLQGNFGTH